MRSLFLSVIVAALTAAPLYAQSPADELAEINRKLADVQQRIERLAEFPGYNDAAAQAVREQKPLVFFYGTGYPRAVAGCVVGRQDYGELAGFDAGIIVAVPARDWLDYRTTLPATATDADIRAAIAPRQVRPVVAAPFAAPDADLPAAVAALLDGMERYQSARLTQVSGNRSGGGSNSAVGRLSVPRKWSVPGGLDGLTGWSNRLYRLPRNPVRNWLGHVDANDRWADGRVIGNWGGLSEITYQREYGEKAKFADVLLTNRGVFEVRLAERIGGEWQRSVPYRDRAAEPAGYQRVSLQQCASCHDGGMSNPDAPGSGGYGSARIPGGGGVYSEAMSGVE